MYPMRSQIWSFFQKLGAAASSPNSLQIRTKRESNKTSARREVLNPLAYFSNTFRPRSASDPDSMYLRYTILTATCITVAILIIKLVKH